MFILLSVDKKIYLDKRLNTALISRFNYFITNV